MKKIIYKFISLSFLLIILLVAYLSFIGIETKRFNKQIDNQLKNFNKNLEIQLKEVKIVLDIISFKFNVKTTGPKLKIRDKLVELESIKTQIPINSIINNEFLLKGLKISTKSLDVKKFISFSRSIKKNSQLFILENFIEQGYLIADIEIEFDSEGNIKDDYKIKGFVQDTKINFFDKYEIEKLNLIFDINNKNFKFKDIQLSINNIPFISEKIDIKKIKNEFSVKGNIINKNINFKKGKSLELIKSYFQNFNIQNLEFGSNNDFSFVISKKFRINKVKIQSEIKLKNLSLIKELQLRKMFPEFNNKINFNDHKININYHKKNLSIEGDGKIFFQNKEDKINYLIKKNKNQYEFYSSLTIQDNPLNIDLLNYKKEEESKIIIDIEGKHFINKKTLINKFSFKEKENKIKIKKLIFDKDFKLDSFLITELDYFDIDQIKNKIQINKKDKTYFLKGSSLNINKLIENILSDSDDKVDLLNQKFNLNINIDQVFLDKDEEIKNLKGNIFFDKNEISNANLDASFLEGEKFKFTVNSTNEETVTTLILDKAESIVKRYDFIKGYEEGVLDFSSVKKGNKSNSKLKIYDFKLKKLPALTKILTLASLTGIADILSGEGIGFDEFEMDFENENKLMTINEIYAIGPAISILMNGYVEKNKIVSLRGTLVPATTINKAIGSIPVLGKILVGSKSGEGVFGVSFKIKGPPKNLETTVNPIKTLTPRFITRTLEKIKKN